MSKKTKDQQTLPHANGKPVLRLTNAEIDELSPIQKRIYCLLADGKPHPREEIWQCLQDEFAPIQYIYPHITFLRQRLERKGILLSGKNPVLYSLEALPENHSES